MDAVTEETVPESANRANTARTDSADLDRSRSSFDRSFVKSVAWTGAAKWSGQIVSWGSTIFVARILTPNDYGVVAMANIFIGLTAMLSEFGIGTAVVSLPNLTENKKRQLNAFAVLTGVICMLLACAAAVPLSKFFKSPEVVLITIVLSTGFVAAGFRTVPDALLQKDHRFRKLAILDVLHTFALAIVSLVLAFSGFGYWTLVLSTVVGRTVSAVLAMNANPVGYAWPRRADIREALTFGSHLVAMRLSWFFYSNADFTVAGKLLGKGALGHYTIAWDIASAPIGKITTLLMRVTPAYFASIQDDVAQLRRYLLMTTGSLALITFPAAIGLMLVAPEFIPTVVGEKWLPAVRPLQLIAFYASFRSVTPLISTMLAVIGETRLTMKNSFVASIMLPASFVLASRWGVSGIAASWIIVHPIVLAPLYRRLFQRIQLSFVEYLGSLKPAIVCCAVMLVVVPLIRTTVGQEPTAVHRLALEVAGGATVYIATLALFFRDRLRPLLRLFARNRFATKE